MEEIVINFPGVIHASRGVGNHSPPLLCRQLADFSPYIQRQFRMIYERSLTTMLDTNRSAELDKQNQSLTLTISQGLFLRVAFRFRVILHGGLKSLARPYFNLFGPHRDIRLSKGHIAVGVDCLPYPPMMMRVYCFAQALANDHVFTVRTAKRSAARP